VHLAPAARYACGLGPDIVFDQDPLDEHRATLERLDQRIDTLSRANRLVLGTFSAARLRLVTRFLPKPLLEIFARTGVVDCFTHISRCLALLLAAA
jgi:hypothetical protein